jgi:NAD(P)-dependent dehydrogenase (short-subunit alcohol dehydrogenase family)
VRLTIDETNVFTWRAGRIILIASEAGMRTIPHMAAYSVSKSAMIGLGRVLAEGTKGQLSCC